MSESFALIDKTKSNLEKSRLLFESIKNEVLGKDYELELVFVDEKESGVLNETYHHKEGPTNILSFPLDKAPFNKVQSKSGQIFICPAFAKKEAPKFERKYKNYIAFLFIHGVIHLKGFTHGSKMESEEQKIRRQFSI